MSARPPSPPSPAAVLVLLVVTCFALAYALPAAAITLCGFALLLVPAALAASLLDRAGRRLLWRRGALLLAAAVLPLLSAVSGQYGVLFLGSVLSTLVGLALLLQARARSSWRLTGSVMLLAGAALGVWVWVLPPDPLQGGWLTLTLRSVPLVRPAQEQTPLGPASPTAKAAPRPARAASPQTTPPAVIEPAVGESNFMRSRDILQNAEWTRQASLNRARSIELSAFSRRQATDTHSD